MIRGSIFVVVQSLTHDMFQGLTQRFIKCLIRSFIRVSRRLVKKKKVVAQAVVDRAEAGKLIIFRDACCHGENDIKAYTSRFFSLHSHSRLLRYLKIVCRT